MSGALYGVPVWCEAMRASRKILRHLHSVQRLLAFHIVRAYCTSPSDAIMVLAGIPPAEYLAEARAWLYARVKASCLRGNTIAPRTMSLWRERARQRATEEWRNRLAMDPPTVGTRVLKVVLPYLEEWVDRSWGSLPFRMTQVFPGSPHGCFGEYLCRIGKKPTTRCHHCEAKLDSAQHTLKHCPTWEELSEALKGEIGDDLSLRAVVAKKEREEHLGRGPSGVDVAVSTREAVRGRKELAALADAKDE
ncbi:uncharacterized protein LOC105198753 [Solenopsis invicta]|uniref:uncharacterized protein LOC105198753 n=1 Tax=Solenopsis invicta TaxID=13686 RepID=UPI00193DA59C|nr:uncharacterized protein LOC105198753 [Solenopsis invicta]